MPDLIFAYPLTAWVGLVAAGLLIGGLAGLLGVGGGVVAVPVLIEVFEVADVAAPEVIPLAIGTAQANVLLVSLSAAGAHWRRGTVDRRLIGSWLPWLVIGIAAGLVLGPLLPARLLTQVFAGVTALLGLKMALGPQIVLSHTLPRGTVAHIPPILVGGLAAALGVGGGTLSTPVLSLFSFPIHRAIGAGALFNLIVAVPATLAFLAQDWGVTGRPADAVGDVALSCVAALTLPALFVAPVAARWSARAPVVLLRRSFAVCLCAIAVRILMRP